MRQSKDWYDKIITPDNLKKYYSGLYAARSDMLLRLCRKHLPPSPRILEVAAGCSYNAENFLRIPGVTKYVMNDFADIVRREADLRIQDSRFETSSTDAETANFDFGDFNVGICISLEHIENDRALLGGFEDGSLLVLGSPNGDARAHVRYFCSEGHFVDTYSDTVDILESGTSGPPSHEKYVLCGHKK